MYVAKITARSVSVGEQLFTPYGRGQIIAKHLIKQSCRPLLLQTPTPHVVKPVLQTIISPILSATSDVEFVPHIAPTLSKHYGYSTDCQWENTMRIPGAREICRNHMAYNRNPTVTEEEAVTYLLDISERIFTLHIKSMTILSSSILGDDTCGFRALHQATKRAATPLHLRDNVPMKDVNYRLAEGTGCA